jgi:hypothetical protein
MPELYWFGVMIRFPCPTCHLRSAEQIVLSADQPGNAAINHTIQRYKLICQLCRAPLPSGSQVDVHVEPGTPERLKSLGYHVPPHADK